nr:MAG TPA: hypothetical protein [Caudoviricetes sp.]
MPHHCPKAWFQHSKNLYIQVVNSNNATFL